MVAYEGSSIGGIGAPGLEPVGAMLDVEAVELPGASLLDQIVLQADVTVAVATSKMTIPSLSQGFLSCKAPPPKV